MKRRLWHSFLCSVLVFLLALLLTFPGLAGTIPFSSASATFEQAAPFDVLAAIDGVISGNNGWGVKDGQFSPQTAIFRCATPVDASLLLVTLHQVSSTSDQHLNEFRISVTADANASLLGGNWTPLEPLEVTSTSTALIVTNGYCL